MPTHAIPWPSTPSPHRFLAPAPPSTQKAKAKPQSGLRHGVAAQTPEASTSTAESQERVDNGLRVTPAKRFVIAAPPRAGANTKQQRVSRGGETTGNAWEYTHFTPTLRPPKLGKVESIDESSPSSSANAAVETGETVLQSVEHSPFLNTAAREAENDEDEEEILFVTAERNKRRRVSPQLPSTPSLANDLPEQHIHTPAPPSHRFKVPAPKTPLPFDNASTPAHAAGRPHFILPRSSPSPTKSVTPLPETFSPSRKNGKYVPNGLASTLQSWIIETADSGYTARSSASSAVVWGRDKEDGVRIRIKVRSASGGRTALQQATDAQQRHKTMAVEAWPGSVVFVQGSTDAGLYNASRASNSFHDDGDGGGPGPASAEVNMLLAGQGGARGKGGIKIKEGSVVGVRAPVWDVDMEGEKWLVGVEWVVLS